MLERIFFEISCEESRMLMQQYLEAVDRELEEGRDKAELRRKGSGTTTIKTLMGEVSVKRII